MTALSLASTLNGVTVLALVTVILTTPLTVRPSSNTLKDAKFDTSSEKQKAVCHLATSHVSWPKRSNVETFLNAQMTANSLIGALGSVSAHVASVLVFLSLSKFENAQSFHWVTEFAVAHDRSEFATFHGAAKTAL